MKTEMSKITNLIVFATLVGCSGGIKDNSSDIQGINTTLDQWHAAAAAADYNTYFALFADDAVFIGTDATENWHKKEFMVWAKPYFDRGKAWSFTSLERNIFFDAKGTTAWFDELLNTQMKICRGSGVLIKVSGEWKIKHYVLSVTIPNELTDHIVSMKETIENQMIIELQKK